MRFYKKKLLIFDFDGTIADTSPLHEEAFRQILEPLGINFEYSSIAGRKTLEAFRECLIRKNILFDEAKLESLTKQKQTIVRKLIKKKIYPIKGVDDFIVRARENYKLSIASSGSWGTVQLALAKLGYLDSFNPILCSEDVKSAKPDPEIFNKMLDLTGFKREESLIFEDSQAGMEAANKAGVEAVNINRYSFIKLLEEL